MVGLIESVDRYDPNNKASFSTFAGYRIRGSVLNSLEKATERREQSAFRRRYQRQRLDSIADNMSTNVKNDAFNEMVDVALELALTFMLEDSGLIEKQQAGCGDGVYEERMLRDLYMQIGQIVNRLPEREKFIIRNHYFHDIAFEELARLLAISKGRVSQLHKRALQTIKTEYEKMDSLDTYY